MSAPGKAKRPSRLQPAAAKVAKPKRASVPMTARALAISVLARVEATDAYLNVVLDTALDEHRLADSRDSAFVTELCYGAVRRRLTLDAVLAQVSDQKLSKLEDKVLAALRLGAYQLFFTRVPKHAAVSDTVGALEVFKLDRARGFVNAVLRKLAAMSGLPPLDNPDEAVRWAYEESYPPWLVRRWLRQFGAERALAMMRAGNQAAPVVIRANTQRTTRDELCQAFLEMGVEVKPTPVSPLGLVLPPVGKVEELYGYSEGLWQVQDEAAQLVGLFAAAPKNARVLDVCAAPGGKACHLAQTNQVWALDLHANKLDKIRNEAKRLGLSESLRVQAADATKPLPKALGTFDLVLVDAPCSGLGTLRRHPEIRYRRTEDDLKALHQLQAQILETAQAVVNPGGLLVYAVCSTDATEGPDAIEMFLRSHPDFTTESPPNGSLGLPLWQGHLRTLPGPEGWDGFFAARLRRLH